MSQKKGGVALSYITLFLKIGIAFFYTPFLIKSVGESEYGIFNIVGSLLAYVAIVDFGINDTTLRYIIGIRDKKAKDIGAVLGSITFLYCLIGVGIILAGLSIYKFIPSIFSESFTPEEILLTQKIFVWSIMGLFFTLFFNPLGAILLAYERFVLLKVIEIASYITTIGVAVFLLFSGHGIYSVVVASAIINIGAVAFKFLYCFAILKFPFYLRYFGNSFLSKMVGYAAPIFIVVIVEQIYWKLDNILIGSVIGASAVAIYAIGFFFQKYILSFAQSFSRVFIPSFISEIENGATRNEITQSLIRIARLQLMAVLPIITSLAYFGEEFILLWLGASYAKAYYVLLFAMVPFSIEIIGNVRNTVMQVKELYWYRSIVILVIALVNVAATYYFLSTTGDIVYAAMSTGVSLFVGYVIIHYILYVKKLLEVSYFLTQVWIKALPTIAIMSAAAFCIKLIDNYGWLYFGSKIIVFTGVFLVTLYFTYLNESEKGHVTKIISKFKS
jgi:O-antigen/teichoic acid export membrane protein